MGSYQFYLVLLCVIWSITDGFYASDVPSLISRRYGTKSRSRYGLKGSRKGGTKTKPKGTSLYGKQTAGMVYEGGCTEPPTEPEHAKLRCSFYSGCSLSCKRGYALPGGAYASYIMCENGKWIAQDTGTTEMPKCQPACSPPCQNQGICIAPDQCSCPDQYSGPQCQFENKPCLELPPMPQNTRRSCRPKLDHCTIECLPGHQFPDGSKVATLTCKNGLFVPGRNDWVTVPDCQPTCSPPCQNGGVCLSLNVCQCPQEFRGPQCQYGLDVCTSSKLNFNGGLRCAGDADKFTCTDLYCAEGMKLSHEAAPAYTCKYSEGVFHPSDVPTCVSTDPNMNYTVTKTSHYSHGIESDVGSSSDYDFSFNEESSQDAESRQIMDELRSVIIENKLPVPGTCYHWGGVHYKTYDDRIYSFDSECAYILVQDSIDNTFSVSVRKSGSCNSNNTNTDCHKLIDIYIQGRDYRLSLTDDGHPLLTHGNTVLPIPGQAVGIRTETTARYINVMLDSVGVSIKWDAKQFIQVDAKESLWNRTEGLCGNMNGNPDDDIVTKKGVRTKNIVNAAASWQVDSIGAHCESAPIEKRQCPDTGVKGSLGSEAKQFCAKLLSDSRFSSCSEVLDRSLLIEACSWDYCNCASQDKTDCACDTMNVYVSECKHEGLTEVSNWRDDQTCPMKCSGGRVYKACGPSKNQPVCGSSNSVAVDPKTCEEGCFCPEGKVLHNGECISENQCPCRLRKKEFPAGSSVPKDCNTCTCQNGHWVCTQVSCGARCSAIGDPHYTTFDGKKYDFMGQCSYYLLEAAGFSVETENVACPGAISELMGFTKTATSEMPSCTKTATIRVNGSLSIKLGQNHQVVVNGQEITKLPLETAGIKIRIVSSIFLQVLLPNGVDIWWDGVSRLYIDVPASLKEKTKGLCGTFNENQKDDFLTPEGDTEQSAISFANKWKTHEACSNMPSKIPSHPCDVNMHRKTEAEKVCSVIKSELFSDCYFYVDPDQYYQDCLYDMCSCQGDMRKCLCTIISSYAHECANKGIQVNWRSTVKECSIQCPAGQEFQICGDSCARSCHDISTHTQCKKQCVEGCNCPAGQALDDNGECIPTAQCKCYSNGLVFNPGYKEIRRNEKSPELCSCVSGGWSCKEATMEEVKVYPDAADLKSMCNSSHHMEFTSCEPAEPITCKNMDSYTPSSPAICHAGCQCKKGYVLDPTTKHCIKPSDCPCHHGAKSYKENEVVQNDCNTCTCKNGKWSCTDRQCAAECSAWGDSHYKTFDGKHYDYQGQCDYVLAKGAFGDLAAFDISIQNIPCGTLGTTCSKSVNIRVSVSNVTESLVLDKGKPLPKPKTLNTLTVREIGLYAIIEAPVMGLTIRWDKGTRVYVRLNPKWKNKVNGLCGNYNDNELDDFQTPSGGMTEVSPYAFGDSWKMDPYCPEAQKIIDTCKEKPERRVWAVKKCGILKSSLFMACHSEVPIDSFYDKCLFDACGCDQGGDCECLCTALAAYAQECNNRGVPIHWRSQELCPIQCDERCSTYTPCMSTCLVETCDNIYTRGKISATCVEDTCVEGCQFKPCPTGQVFFNSSYDRCIPANECKPVCMVLNGVTYLEGDVIEEDGCHTCYCSRGQKNCKGMPCTEMPTTTPSCITAAEDQEQKCVSGWTQWINQNPIVAKKGINKRPLEKEPLPTSLVLNNLTGGAKCPISKMTDIRCRTVDKKIPAKETGLDAECSLERGLVCKSSKKGQGCPDFEIQVYCQCGGTTETETTTATATETMKVSRTVKPEEITEKWTPSTPSTTTQSPCDSLEAKKIDEEDCHKYLVCSNGFFGVEYVSQTCGSSMMFNPKTKNCDLVSVVTSIRPECAPSTTVATTKAATVTATESITPESRTAVEILTGKPEATTTTKAATMTVTQSITPESRTAVEILTGKPEATTSTSIYNIVITGKPGCDPNTPNGPHESDCHKFYVCKNGPDGPEYVEQTCGDSMMYNPKTLTCDHIDAVTAIRPECAVSTSTVTTTTAQTEQTKVETIKFTVTKPTTTRSTTEEEGEEELVTENDYIIFTSKPECSLETPNQPDENDCHSFYVCHNGPNGPEYIEQTCGKSMMFNTVTKKCDDAKVVKSIRPECAKPTHEEDEMIITPGPRKLEEPSTLAPLIVTGHPQCDAKTLNRPHESDCKKFFVCQNGPNGAEYVEQTCEGPMLYNPHTFSCDKEEFVLPIRPECDKRCPSGLRYRDCAISCMDLCMLYKDTLQRKGMCTGGQTCESGCVTQEVYDMLENRQCVGQKKWANNGTCVNIQDCMCVSHDGKPVKPGAVVHEDGCKICQCIQNYYSCDESQCHTTTESQKVTRPQTTLGTQSTAGQTITMARTPSTAGQTMTMAETQSTAGQTVTMARTPSTAGQTVTMAKTPSTAGQTVTMARTPSTAGQTVTMARTPSTAGQTVTMEITPSTTKQTVTTAATPKTTVPYIIAVNTITPAPPCDQSFISLLTQNLPDDSFRASSSLNNNTQAKEARFNNKVSSWTPSPSDKHPFLVIDLLKEQPIYGVQIRGNPKKDEYVTSYELYHSAAGTVYSPAVRSKLKPVQFRGSIDSNTPAFQKFIQPFEARYLKIVPTTWHNNISLRVDYVGCGEELSTTVGSTSTTVSSSTTPEITTTMAPPICTDELGSDVHPLSEDQITVSSQKEAGQTGITRSPLKSRLWQPLVDSPSEWIEFNFLEPRNLTGFYTKGGDDGWVEAVKVKYSHDGKKWNPIVNKKGIEVVFPANYDEDSKITNYFTRPIQAQYIRLYPVKWHKTIQMITEIIGCYKPYPTTTTVTTTVGTSKPTEQTTTSTSRTTQASTSAATQTMRTEGYSFTQTFTASPCNYCPGVPSSNIELGACECTADKWWNGTGCAPRALCPCVLGSLIYPVGKLFNKEDCSECVCKIGGIISCDEKICGRCPEGLRSTVSSDCECGCEACPPRERLCPTSNICIDETLWCDGIENCPDDEVNCPTPTSSVYVFTLQPKTIRPTTNETVCPVVNCPPNFRKIVARPRYNRYASSRFTSIKGRRRGYKGVKGGRVKGGIKGGVKGGVKGRLRALSSPKTTTPECIQYRCVHDKEPPPYKNSTVECKEEDCPPGYEKADEIMVDVDQTKKCPVLICMPKPVPDAVCNVTGRTFNTFDGTEYKYDICDHVIARDMVHNEWAVILTKECEETCTRDLHIYVGQDHFILHPDLTVNYNGYAYTINQLMKISRQSKEFTISKVGNVIALTFLPHGFWVEWNSDGNVKVGVVHSLIQKVDGLCGYFDQNIINDKRKPDGRVAPSTRDFGDSWSVSNETRAACKVNACPAKVQNEAWQLCNSVRDDYLQACSKVINIDASVSRCLDTACDCLMSSTKENVTNTDRCKCDILQSFVVECLTANPTVEVSGWRGQYDCPSKCEAPLIYKDCFQRECEPTCESLGDPSQCPKIDHACYPGCYCPEELVRKGDKCIKPTECRDCECKATGQLDFLTYDESNFTISGNCVYVLTRDQLSDKHNKHNFEVLLTNGPCATNSNRTCIKKVTILYKTHQIMVLKDEDKKTFKILIDSGELSSNQKEQNLGWVNIKKGPDTLNIVIPSDQLEVTIKHPDLSVNVRVPSYKYGSKLEGLCGDCNKNPDDDLRVPNGTVTTDVEDFGLSWLYDGLPEKQSREQCKVKPEEQCKPLPDSKNPCIHLMDTTVFGACHPVVDSSIYKQWCDKETCNLEGKYDEATVCGIIDSYAKACAKEGICMDWHFDMCPRKECTGDKVYSACGTTCTKTCENMNAKETTCVSEVVEGCFCPEGKVLKGDICVEERECIYCDDQGHHPGDKWKKDICTNCTCEGTKLMCQKTECPAVDTICEQGFTPVKVMTKTRECCDKYTCVPISTTTQLPTCPTPQPVICGEDKIAKLHKKDDGCYQNICECIPKNECKSVDMTTPTPLEDGLVKVVDESDCCPKIQMICKPETCKQPPKCQEFYELKTEKDTNKCCSTYTCVPPADKCIVENKYTAAKEGGERPRTAEELQKVLKNTNETWNDGPCHTCQCQVTPKGDVQAVCTEKQCPVLEKSADYAEYVLEAQPLYNQCCAKFVRTACKVNGKPHSLDEEWFEGEDYCSKHKCAKNTEGDIIKEVQVTKCVTDCKLGYEYVPATAESKQCCGSCKAVACVVNGTVRREGEEWMSPDYCTSYKCSIIDGSMRVEGQQKTCPKISQEILDNYVVNITKLDKECCEKTEVVSCKSLGQIYQVDETWVSKDNPCKNFKCSRLDNTRLAIVEYMTACNTTCPLGFTYKPEDANSDKCCGSCSQTSCIINGQIKEIGENWSSEDYCTKFSCKDLNGSIQVEKDVIKCNDLPKEVVENYVVKTEKVQGECCNKTEVVACKGTDGTVHKPGEEWTIGTDYCKIYKCMNSDQRLVIGVTQTECNTTCPNGYEYKEAPLSEKTCCGKCKQSACILNDTVKNVGEEWSSLDNCHQYKCENSNGVLQITGTDILCVPPADETLKRFVVESKPVPGECCNKTVMVACKGNNLTYGIGDTWIEDNDYCVKYECAKENEGLIIKRYVSSCNTTCSLGFEYEPATAAEATCCGNCKQTQCVVNGVLRDIGQQWESDDHCEKYKCGNVSGVIQVLSEKVVCERPSENSQRDFVIEETPVPGQCCSKYKEVACKVDNKTYQIGQIWPTEDPCKNVTCTRNDHGDIVKQDLIQSCHANCELGFEYKPVKGSCCGICEPVACVINGELKKPGDIWSTPDGCTNFTCTKSEDRLIVTAHSETCPSLADCPADRIYKDGCCEKCNLTSSDQRLCDLESIPLDKTISLIRTENIMHGVCVNKKPIPNLTECVGTCESSTQFDSRLGHHMSVCTCCQALEYKKIVVPLDCDDGYKYDKHIDVPSVCSCNGCQGGLSRLMQGPSKSGRKGGTKNVKGRTKSKMSIVDP